MMQIKLTRDQARAVRENFLNYLVQLADMKVRDSEKNIDENLNCRVIRSLTNDIKKKYDKKLLTASNTLRFNFTDAEGITLYKLLMFHPMPANQYWYLNLRDMICESLHRQICEPS
jgi:predicted ATP-dependent endonuclease of OLD family